MATVTANEFPTLGLAVVAWKLRDIKQARELLAKAALRGTPAERALILRQLAGKAPTDHQAAITALAVLAATEMGETR